MLKEKEVRKMYQGKLNEAVKRMSEDVTLWRLRQYLPTFDKLYALGEVLEISREGTEEALAEQLMQHWEEMRCKQNIPA